MRALIKTQKRKKWFSPGVDRVSSFQPGEFISCFKRDRRGSFPALQSAAFPTTHTHTHPQGKPNHFPSISITDLSPSPCYTSMHAAPSSQFLSLCPLYSLAHSLSHSRRQPHTPAGVMLRCSLLTFPGRPAEAFQIVLFMQTCRRGAADTEVKLWTIGGPCGKNVNKHERVRALQSNTCASLQTLIE